MASSSDGSVEIRIKGGLDPSLQASTAAAIANMDELTAAAEGWGAKLTAGTVAATQAAAANKTLAAGLTESAAAADASQVSISTATREFRALFDELSSGRVRLVPGTMAILANRVFGVGLAGLGAVAGVLAIAAAIGGLAYNAAQAQEAIEKLNIKGAFAGGIGLSESDIQALINRLDELPGVSRTDSEKLISDFIEVGAKGREAFEGLTEASTRYAQSQDITVQQAGERLARVLDSQKVSVAELQKVFPGLSAAEAEAFINTQKLGDQNQTAAALIELVANRSHTLTGELAKQDDGLKRVWSNFQTFLGALQGMRSFQQEAALETKTATQRIDEQTEALLRDAAAMRAMPKDNSSQFDKDVQASSRSTAGRITELRDAIARYQADIANPAATEQEKQNFRSMIEDNKREIATLTKRQDAPDNEAARKAQEQQVTWAREASEQLNEMSRSTYDSDITAARSALEEKKALYQEEYEAGTLTAQEKTQKVIAAINEEAQAEQAANKAELAYSAQSLADFDQYEKQKVNIANQTQAAIAAATRQGMQEVVEANKKAAAEDAKTWTSVNREITSGVDNLVSDIFTKRQGLAADLEQVGVRMLQQEIANDAKSVTMHQLAALEKLSVDKSTSEEGLLYKIGTYLTDQVWTKSSEAAKTGAVTAGVTQRTTVQAAGDATGLEAHRAVAAQTIQTDAAQAASGAYQSASQIPYIGWILGPVAAAGAYAGVMAFGSFEVGADRIPHDMVANIHKDEMIIPAEPAEAIRARGGIGGGFNMSAMAGNTFNNSQIDRSTTNHFSFQNEIHGGDNRSIADMLEDHAMDVIRVMNGWQRDGRM